MISVRTLSKRRLLGTVIIGVIAIAFGTSLLTRESTLQSEKLLPHGKALMTNHVRVRFVTGAGRLVSTYYWSTAHADGKGTDVTDIFNSDIIESGSGMNNHIPKNYSFDQTNVKNIKSLHNIKLGETVSLVVVKKAANTSQSLWQRIVNWFN
ncbi:hypothetical protein [Secundilactobacillus collinoides]|uniref:Uncharacterized protein n=2 Tax=Secundilactobacillus collinoides TaxID=33960 RepID=A0A0R2BCN6_SECCO|nr:hypothetical protein [Secundilactobacillus collinoides]KRM76881.1 hypothetical protein FC82_GL000985 [Secundilactobacillus collinoides DSM 20515 = JCM 1123]KZL36680.1 hypothetical protein TY91_13630 [Secundilactobacillus collinoides]